MFYSLLIPQSSHSYDGVFGVFVLIRYDDICSVLLSTSSSLKLLLIFCSLVCSHTALTDREMNCALSRVELAAHAQISKRDLGLISLRSPDWSLLVLSLLVIVDGRWFGWSLRSCAWLFCLWRPGESVFCSPLVPFHASPQMPFSFGWWPLAPGSTVKRRRRRRPFNQEPLVCLVYGFFFFFFKFLGICWKYRVGIVLFWSCWYSSAAKPQVQSTYISHVKTPQSHADLFRIFRKFYVYVYMNIWDKSCLTDIQDITWAKAQSWLIWYTNRYENVLERYLRQGQHHNDNSIDDPFYTYRTIFVHF